MKVPFTVCTTVVDIFTLVELIGNDRIEEIVSEIRRRSQILEHECIDPTQQIINDEGVVWATMNKNRETNITCWTSTRGRFPSGTIPSSSFFMTKIQDLTQQLTIEQIIRWKTEYPEWRRSSTDISKSNYKGVSMPKFCSSETDKEELYKGWLTKNEPWIYERNKWPTNEYDIRNEIPWYMQPYLQSDLQFKLFNL